MGAFGGLTLTNKGIALQAKAQAGAELHYTRVAIGDGNLGGQSIATLNNLINERMSLDITKLKVLGQGRAVIGTVLTNQGITTGFYFREIGIFALDPDEGEILYAYANAGNNAEYIPPGGGPDVVEKHIDSVVAIGQAANVTATIDQSLVFATVKDLSDHQSASVLDHPDGSVTTAKLANGAVTSSKLANGAATDSVIGNRTISDSSTPSSDSGTLTNLLSWLAYMIKAITGKSNWRTAPATSLEAAKAHMDATTGVHGATSAATPNRIVQRDSQGRIKAAAPAAADDVARKAEVDAKLSKQDNKEAYVGAVYGRYANGVSIRDIPGNVISYTASDSTPDLPPGFTGGDGMLAKFMSFLSNGDPQHTVQFWWHVNAARPRMFMSVFNQNFDTWSGWFELLHTDQNGRIYIGNTQIIVGSGSPEGNITAPPGSIYLNTSGGAGKSFYVKESGTGNTGWVAK